jgi:hypothetical protein
MTSIDEAWGAPFASSGQSLGPNGTLFSDRSYSTYSPIGSRYSSTPFGGRDNMAPPGAGGGQYPGYGGQQQMMGSGPGSPGMSSPYPGSPSISPPYPGSPGASPYTGSHGGPPMPSIREENFVAAQAPAQAGGHGSKETAAAAAAAAAAADREQASRDAEQERVMYYQLSNRLNELEWSRIKEHFKSKYRRQCKRALANAAASMPYTCAGVAQHIGECRTCQGINCRRLQLQSNLILAILVGIFILLAINLIVGKKKTA